MTTDLVINLGVYLITVMAFDLIINLGVDLITVMAFDLIPIMAVVLITTSLRFDPFAVDTNGVTNYIYRPTFTTCNIDTRHCFVRLKKERRDI